MIRTRYDISDCIHIGTDELGYDTCDTKIFDDNNFEDLNRENERKNKRESRFKPGIWYSIYKRWYVHNKSNNSKSSTESSVS